MTDPDWHEVEGTVGKTVYFTVYDSAGDAEDISIYDETEIQLKVWENDGTTLKFEKDMAYVSDGTDGRLKAYIAPGDIAIDDEGAYFFTIELVKAEANTATGVGNATTFQTNLDEPDDFWNGFTITFNAPSALAGEFKVITAYDLTNGEVTAASAFTGAPALNDPFTITPGITVPTIRGTLLITQGAPA